MLAILGFQPIYNTCIENYQVPTSRIIGERGEVAAAGERRYYVQKNYAALTFPCPALCSPF